MNVLAFEELDRTPFAYELVGADHDAVPFSIIVVRAAPGVGPKLHRHPYAEVFIIEIGVGTFQLAEERSVVSAGHVVIVPAGAAHGFVNSGAGELRLVAVHGAARFRTEWLAGPDATWSSSVRD